MDEKSKLKEQLNQEILKWEQKIKEAKARLKLESMDAKDKIQCLIDEMEVELQVAKLQLKKINKAFNETWDYVNKGRISSLYTISEAYEKTIK